MIYSLIQNPIIGGKYMEDINMTVINKQLAEQMTRLGYTEDEVTSTIEAYSKNSAVMAEMVKFYTEFAESECCGGDGETEPPEMISLESSKDAVDKESYRLYVNANKF